LFGLNCWVGTVREKPLGTRVTSWDSIKDRFYKQPYRAR
jgi:hypothetical protein